MREVAAGDPVIVIQQRRDGELQDVPATVVFVRGETMQVAYADGTREELERRSRRWRRA